MPLSDAPRCAAPPQMPSVYPIDNPNRVNYAPVALGVVFVGSLLCYPLAARPWWGYAGPAVASVLDKEQIETQVAADGVETPRAGPMC